MGFFSRLMVKNSLILSVYVVMASESVLLLLLIIIDLVFWGLCLSLLGLPEFFKEGFFVPHKIVCECVISLLHFV